MQGHAGDSALGVHRGQLLSLETASVRVGQRPDLNEAVVRGRDQKTS